MTHDQHVALLIASVCALALVVWLPWCVRRELRRPDQPNWTSPTARAAERVKARKAGAP